MFTNFRNLDLNACLKVRTGFPATGRLFLKIIARGKNEHNNDDLSHSREETEELGRSSKGLFYYFLGVSFFIKVTC